MTQLQEENMTVNVKVESANRGGLLVKYGPYEGFIPVSQFGPVSLLAGVGLEAMRVAASEHVSPIAPLKTLFSVLLQQINPDMMDNLVGSELPVKFLEVDEVRVFLRNGLRTCQSMVTFAAHGTVSDTPRACYHRTRSAWYSATRG
jgi:ribosomal protein S1